MNNLNVHKGQRVTAGRTVLPRRPFESQVHEMKTAGPPWPHVQIKVVYPSIPDLQSPRGGCRR